MNFELITNELDYNKTLKILDCIFHAEKGTKEGGEPEILIMLIEKYETETVGEFPNPNPIEA